MNEEKSLLNDQLDQLRSRTGRCVCRYCGGPLELRQITYSNCQIARTEIFCTACGRMEYGVEPEVYQAASAYQAETDFDYYKDMAPSPLKDQMNRARLCDFLEWSLEALDLLGDRGFKARPDLDQARLSGIYSWDKDALSTKDGDLS